MDTLTPPNREAALRLLASTDTPLVPLVRAADILGPGWLAWEPDTLWRELAERGVDPSAAVRDRLHAGIALIVAEGFFHDGIVYGKTCLAACDGPTDPRVIEPVPVAELAWGTEQALDLRSRRGPTTPEFDHEPRAFAACCLLGEGFYLPPPMLAFAGTRLDKMRLAGSPAWLADARTAIAKIYAGDGAPVEEEPKTPLDAEVARHHRIAAYVRAGRAHAAEALAALG